ncbi:IucA/IucC family siderophore biosynthesis protein [Flavivirga sp. 57AJ16]|uniref:IucA/IucC family protein n=1 Tax=Flavivirga sp. 57AJ16 TaxID=3025307 RepID=UPI002365732C|nr:IucA/IucC family siderophore biosynthesis protein [Flavivirga sp. 57AJ16]MDD7887573.1 IucA/IucC family siderophore biosynthesis protein [Flavivirga sp. 57AJ16]
MMETIEDITINTAHLNVGVWDKVNRNILAKSIAELMREDVVHPEIIRTESNGRTWFRIITDIPDITYSYAASPRYLNYWYVEKHSILKNEKGGADQIVNVSDFFIENQKAFKMDSFTLTHYIEELQHTLFADAYIHYKGRRNVSDLMDLDFQTIEHNVTDGHPWVIVNKGRLGFGLDDYMRYSPEADQEFQLFWIGVHRSRSFMKVLSNETQDNFLKKELGARLFREWKETLYSASVDPDDYILVPVHPWQWKNKLALQFSTDIAKKYIIPLGFGGDYYSPQQSIRTLFNKTEPQKHYVKTALSILNTSHIRGLSPKQLSVAPQLTEWLKGMLLNDAYLQNTGITLLGEVASVSYRHSKYERIEDAPYQYHQFLGAMWRESPVNYTEEGEKPITMASLLYVDEHGDSFIQELINRSGLTVDKWLRQYLRVYLKPILQIFYGHSINVDPHGQNTIVVLKDFIPVRIMLQDFVGDILLNEEAQQKLPKEFSENMFVSRSNPENAPLSILIAIFDAFFRYLSNILIVHSDYSEDAFWTLVYRTVLEYQSEHPELKEKFKKYNIFIPEFKRLVFNSRRLYGGYGETSDFPHMNKKGYLPNPLIHVWEQVKEN